MVKIGSPLFILREECAADLTAVLEKLAEIGYEGIEFLGFFGHKPANIKNKLDSLGLAAVGNHVPFDYFAENTDKVIDEHQEIGCKYITVGTLNAEYMPGGAGYTRALEILERLGEAVNGANMKLLYHNHATEIKIKENEKSALEHIFDDARSDLLYCELDLGWISIGGGEPAYYLEKYKDRCPVIHFKDYIPAETDDGFLFRPTGYGIVNNAELYALSKSCNPEWYIMDHDCAYERDSYFDLTISLEYFKNLIKLA